MYYLLAQLILAARRKSEGGWEQMVFLVVMAVAWVIGGIAKARANKVKKSDFPEEKSESRGETHKGPGQRVQRRVQPAAASPVTKVATAVKKHRVQPSIVPGDMVIEPTEVLLSDISTKPSQEKAATGKSKLDLDSSDKLKKAVLYQEILGKPLSLRRPSESGF